MAPTPGSRTSKTQLIFFQQPFIFKGILVSETFCCFAYLMILIKSIDHESFSNFKIPKCFPPIDPPKPWRPMTDPILFFQPNICAVGTFIETPAPATACVNYKFSALQPHHGSSHGTTLTDRLVSWQSTKRWGARWYRDVVHIHV